MHPAIIIGTVRSLIVDVAMGQIPRSTERISSSSNNHGNFFIHMLFCKHVRLSCVINAYSLTYLLTYLNFPVPFLRGESVTHFVRVEWIELYSMGEQKPVIALSEFVLHFRYVSPF